MCRCLANSGSPITLEPQHSLIDRSQHARMGLATTNGKTLSVFRYSTEPRPLFFTVANLAAGSILISMAPNSPLFPLLTKGG